MKPLLIRLGIGLCGLAVFGVLGMLSVNEWLKSMVVMSFFMLGLLGILVLGHPRVRWVSRMARAIYLLFFLDVAIKGFLRDYFGLRPNPSLVMQALLNTNEGETQEFLMHNGADLAQSALIFGVVTSAAWFAESRLARSQHSAPLVRTSRRTHTTVVVLFALLVGLHFNPTFAKENPLLVWPLRYINYHQQLAYAASVQERIAQDMAPHADWKVKYHGADQQTVVWVIGESFNRFNFSLYGYPRATTPALDALRDELLVFKDVVSSDASTMESLMKMLTPADLAQPDLWMQQPSVLMLAKEAGYKTFWLSNHVPGDGWLGLASAQADVSNFINRGAGRGENNFDASLVPQVAKALADSAPKKLIVVHLLGAHLRYDMRYPAAFSQFNSLHDPVSTEMKNAGRSRWIRLQRNQYDNAILYSNSVLASLIQSTAKASQGVSASLLFSPDHAQEVGHTRNHAGHSAADPSGYEIPLLLWQNEANPTLTAKQSALENRPYQTDHLDHTVLGLLGISTVFYSAQHDLLSDSFLPSQRTINRQPYPSAAEIN